MVYAEANNTKLGGQIRSQKNYTKIGYYNEVWSINLPIKPSIKI